MEYPQINGYGGFGGYSNGYNTNGYNTNGRGVSALYNGAYGYPYSLEDYTAPERDFKSAWTVSTVLSLSSENLHLLTPRLGVFRSLALVGTLLVPEARIW
jgi:hypothetical protein